jgi:RNA ligase (TIGR02306 family)
MENFEYKRKLASIRKIADIQPIPGADSIEVLTVDGWKVVSQKGNFQVGDYCVYFEVDSFLPVKEQFEFLRKNCFKSTTNLGDGFRLKTIRLKKQISQGLVLPVSDFSEHLDASVLDNLELPFDVTELLGVQKYEAPISPNLRGTIKGNFPSFIPKTDQERVQNIYRSLVRDNLETEFEASLKLDGSSMTVYLNGENFGVCSRNLDLLEDETNTFWKVVHTTGLKDVMIAYGKNIALQGELMGPGVQGNREQLKDHKFFMFDVFFIDEGRHALPQERYKVLKDLRALSKDGHLINHVPVLGKEYNFPLQRELDDLISTSEIKSLTHAIGEGIVYKSMTNGTSFKVINNQFLLKEKD